MHVDPADRRQAEILRMVGNGSTGQDAATRVGINRKTLARWRERIAGFGAAYEQAKELSSDGSKNGRKALDLLVAAWTPGGLVALELQGPESEEEPAVEPEPEFEHAETSASGDTLEREPQWVRERCQSFLKAADPAPVVEPDVLDKTGTEITVPGDQRRDQPASPYTTVRPPTREEWLAEMAAMAKDERQPERVRITAIAAVAAGLFGGPGGRSTRPSDLGDAPPFATGRGRDPGVPASVWQEARRNFLGVAPGADDEDARADQDSPEQPKSAASG